MGGRRTDPGTASTLIPTFNAGSANVKFAPFEAGESGPGLLTILVESVAARPLLIPAKNLANVGAFQRLKRQPAFSEKADTPSVARTETARRTYVSANLLQKLISGCEQWVPDRRERWRIRQVTLGKFGNGHSGVQGHGY